MNNNLLLKYIYKLAFKRGDFVLTSGEKSNFYLDIKRISLDSYGSLLIANKIIDKFWEDKQSISSICGIELGSVSIVGSILPLMSLYGSSMNGFIIRKSNRNHGIHKVIVGSINNNENVILIDDVVTTGSSVQYAIKKIEEYNGNVIKIISVVDRNEGGREFFLKNGYDYDPLVKIEEIFEYEKYMQ